MHAPGMAVWTSTALAGGALPADSMIAAAGCFVTSTYMSRMSCSPPVRLSKAGYGSYNGGNKQSGGVVHVLSLSWPVYLSVMR